MVTPHPTGPAPLRLGCPIQFHDRWQGTLVGLEVDEEWEVLNIVISRGFWRWTTRVKLALSAATHWSYESLFLDCTSSEAFARTIPPVAAPARSLTLRTPLSLAGARLLGLRVERTQRRALDIIIHRRGGKYRVPVAAVSFDGKDLHIGAPEQELRPYMTDDELLHTIRDILTANPRLAGDERSALTIAVSGGVVTIGGNVRTKQMKDWIRAWLAEVATATTEIRLEVVDDIDLEQATGQALDRAGLQHRAAAYARSLLGEVTLFGQAPSVATVDEITRVVAQVPGVRHVTSQMVIEAGRERPAPSPSPVA